MSELMQLSNGLADAVAHISPSIVTVAPRGRRAISGLVVAPERILTIHHVLESDENITVHTGSGQKLAATVIGRDPGTDLALLNVPNLDATPVKPASGEARVGQMVLLVARPDGVMASHGIVAHVTGPVRMGRGLHLEQVIRTDATPYPGFSGGAMVDASGAVLGVTNAGLARGNGLAIPAEIAWKSVDGIQSGKVSKRAYLGIGSQPVKLPEAQRAGKDQSVGLLVVSVEPDSPAAHAGMHLGDIIVGFAGQKVEDTDDLMGLLTSDRVGSSVPVEIIRAGKPETVSVTVGERVSKRKN